MHTFTTIGYQFKVGCSSNIALPYALYTRIVVPPFGSIGFNSNVNTAAIAATAPLNSKAG